jgi:RNA polymerase sigma factor (sigma-70 family)
MTTKVKKPRREVNNEEFRLAQENKDNQNIIWKELNQYKGLLSSDDLKSCGLQALWRALQYHDSTFSQKFTTSLYRFVHWECRRELRRQNNLKKNTVSIHLVGDIPKKEDSNGAEHREKMTFLQDCMRRLSNEHRTLLEEYYLQRWTYDDMAKLHNCSKESIRGKLNIAVGRLRELCEDIEEPVYSDDE